MSHKRKNSHYAKHFGDAPRTGEMQGKAPYRPAASGTYFLFDLANLLGKFGSDHASGLIRTIERDLADSGYHAMFFIEQRALTWALCNQPSDEERRDLEALCNRADLVTKTFGRRDEADLPMLQVASVVPESVCVTCDRLRDYAGTFPEIVGTDRVKSFTVSRLGGKAIVSVPGLRRPLVIDNRELPEGGTADPEGLAEPAVEPVAPAAVSADEPTAALDKGSASEAAAESPEVVPPAAKAAPHRMPAVRTEIERSNAVAIRIFSEAARKDPAGFYALSDIYARGDENDRKKAAKYETLAMRMEKALKERRRREIRRLAEMGLADAIGCAHFSRRRQKAARLARMRFLQKGGRPAAVV